jgi:hypothetical protein
MGNKVSVKMLRFIKEERCPKKTRLNLKKTKEIHGFIYLIYYYRTWPPTTLQNIFKVVYGHTVLFSSNFLLAN